jgi:hypothetical protein
MLHQEHWDRLPLEYRVHVVITLRTPIEAIGWEECARMFVLYNEFVDIRV